MFPLDKRTKTVSDYMTYRIPPTSTVTSAAAIVVDTLKVVESTILTLPPSN